MNVTYFSCAAEFRRWLRANHRRETEVWIGFRKVGSGPIGITYSEALDEALCFGWIDGVRKRVDDRHYTIRFTPRRLRSRWSLVNVKRVQGLIAAGRLTPAGQAAFDARTDRLTGTYSFEQQRRSTFTPVFRSRFEAEPDAWEYFTSQAPSYQRTATFWVMSAVREDTRVKRLETLIADSRERRRIGLLARPERKDAKR